MRRINPGIVSFFDGGVLLSQSSGTSGNPPGRTSPPSVGSDSGNPGDGVAYFSVSGGISEYWQAVALYQSAGEIPVTPGGRPILKAYNGSQVRWEIRWHTDGGGRLQLFKNGTLMATSTGSHALVSGIHKHFEWHINHANSGGLIEVWVDGVQLPEMTISGNTKDSQPDPIQIEFGTSNDSLGRSYYLSDCIATDQGRIKNAGLKILYPNGAGDINQWSGSYTDIDDVPAQGGPQNDGDTTYSAAASTGLKRLENVDDLSIESTIIGVWVATFMRQFIAGSPAFAHTAIIRRNGVDYEQGGAPNSQVLYTSPGQILSWTNDPAGGAWSKNKINGSFQIGSKS